MRKEINTSARSIKLKVTYKTCIMFQRFMFKINCYFELSIYQRKLKTIITVSTKILSSITVFNIDINKKYFIYMFQKISILELFLKTYIIYYFKYIIL